VTVEEVATLAGRFGWSYETLMAMSGAERRLWLAAAGRVATGRSAAPSGPVGSSGGAASSGGATPTPTPPAAVPGGRTMTTEAEMRARLLELHNELNHRGR
jgi:hypothetical protein